MSKLDLSRFGANFFKPFAPSILKGQVFIAFTDEDTNSFTIQGDNLSSNSSDYELDELEQKLQTKINSVQASIPEIPEGVTLSDVNALLDSLEQRLQAQIDTLQSSGTEQQQNSQSSITIVDDIVYGYHNFDGDSPHLDFSDKKKLRARPVLSCGGDFYLSMIPYSFSGAEYSIYIPPDLGYQDEPEVFAGFGDGKFHTINRPYNDGDDSVVSTTIHNGDFIMNKADNCVYSYDAANHKFIRVGGNQHYIVDYIVDYIGEGVPNALVANNVWTVNLADYNVSLYYWENNQLKDAVKLQQGDYLTSLQSMFDSTAIYCILNDGEVSVLRAIHDLYNGDTVYNKADGYTYTFLDNGTSQSFIRSSSPVIQPVLDILPIGGDIPDKPSAEGEKYLQFYPPESWWTLLYTATSQDTWNDGDYLEVGDRYASITDHKIYEFKNGKWTTDAFHCDVPVGVPFLNKADNCLYFYNGSDFVKITSS